MMQPLGSRLTVSLPSIPFRTAARITKPKPASARALTS